MQDLSNLKFEAYDADFNRSLTAAKTLSSLDQVRTGHTAALLNCPAKLVKVHTRQATRTRRCLHMDNAVHCWTTTRGHWHLQEPKPAAHAVCQPTALLPSGRTNVRPIQLGK